MAKRTPARQTVPDDLAAMDEVDEEERMVMRLPVIADDGHARLLGTRIDLDGDGLNRRVFKEPVDQADREGVGLHDARPARLEELSRPCRAARHQRLFPLVQNKY